MSLKRIHLRLSPHPAPTPNAAIDYACSLAQRFGAELFVSSVQIALRTSSHWLAGASLSAMAQEIEQKAAAKAKELEGYVASRAAAAGIALNLQPVGEKWPDERDATIRNGRTSDLCVVSLPRQGVDTSLIAEEWLFGSGRPCLVYPENTNQAFGLDHIIVCWDGSRAAARAIGDSLPLLQAAKQVRVLNVHGEKDLPAGDINSQLFTLFAAHGISASGDDIDIGDGSIGEAILAHAQAAQADLIVLGAFGHARVMEFLLGGATKDLLDRSTIPLFLSH